MADEKTPASTSAAYDRMQPAWKMVDDILAGPAAVRAAGEAYLPKYGAEGKSEYERRLKQAPWQPEFADILLSLASKPFGKEIALGDGVSARIKNLAEDIDGRGSDLTAFARPFFRKAIAKGMQAILVDNTGNGTARTVAEERAAGVRPYWVSIRPEDIVALYTGMEKGREVPIHVRVLECTVEQDGFGEVEHERVRVLNRALISLPGQPVVYGPPTWTLYEKQIDADGKVTWPEEGKGNYAPLKEIPLVLYWTGEREGAQFVRPPLDALADKQMELYRALSRQDEILTYAGSPMLCGKGIAAPPAGQPPLEVGPKRVLFAPAGADGKATGWDYIQPDAANLTEIRESVKALVDDIRRLGMQPLTQKSGGVTATASSIEGAKAHSAVQAWALGLKDAIEQAFVFTSAWLGEDANVEVSVDTDFSVEAFSQAPLDTLTKARAAKDISRETYLDGLRRFDVLAPDFDADENELQLAEEMQGLEPENDPASTDNIDPITGQPIQPAA
jgi:hypothetical protein